MNCGGQTIHSALRLSPKFLVPGAPYKMPEDPTFKTFWQAVDVIAIDEVSMVRADVMDGIDMALRTILGSKDPFGGVKVLLIGDLFQLPPVVREFAEDGMSDQELLDYYGYRSSHFFAAKVFERVAICPVELTRVYRQADPTFVGLLNCIRDGRDVKETVATMNKRCFRPFDKVEGEMLLTSLNGSAHRINSDCMNELETPNYSFSARVSGRFSESDDQLPAPRLLLLKGGSRVMLTRNDPQGRWVNGSLGVVRGVQVEEATDPETGEKIELESIKVQLDAGPEVLVGRADWSKSKYVLEQRAGEGDKMGRGVVVTKPVGTFNQFPVRLAWAVTIHKSQGLTLDHVCVDIGRGGAFAPGQLYVALSRCRTIEGLRFRAALLESDVKCDAAVVAWHALCQDLCEQVLEVAKTGNMALEP